MLPYLCEVITNFFFPPVLQLSVEDLPESMGYYERINRRAVHVESEAGPATRCALVVSYERLGCPGRFHNVEIGKP